MKTYCMLHITNLLLFIFIINMNIYSQESILTDDRIIDWSPGMPGGIPDYPVGVNITDYGAIGDGITDDTQALLDAIEACPDSHAVIIPAGEYLFTQRIFIRKPIVIRGEGPDQTFILFEGQDDGEGGLNPAQFWIGNYQTDLEVNVTGECNKGSNEITVSDASGFSIGDFVIIRQNNDTAVISTY